MQELIERVKYWQDIMYLHRWDLSITMTKKKMSMVDANPEYLYATIHLSEYVCDNDVDEVLCHEMFHLILFENLATETFIEVLVGIVMKQRR